MYCPAITRYKTNKEKLKKKKEKNIQWKVLGLKGDAGLEKIPNLFTAWRFKRARGRSAKSARNGSSMLMRNTGSSPRLCCCWASWCGIYRGYILHKAPRASNGVLRDSRQSAGFVWRSCNYRLLAGWRTAHYHNLRTNWSKKKSLILWSDTWDEESGNSFFSLFFNLLNSCLPHDVSWGD